MPADLPPGKWSAVLVGPWWCGRPDAVTSAVTYWSNAGAVKRNEASDLHDRRTHLGVNQGRTAEDLLDRYWRGEQRLTTIAHQCQVKSEQSDRVADAVNHLRDRLKEIAKSGNEEIDQIISGQGSTESKVAAVNAVIATKNATAANAAGIAMSNLVDATQRVLDVTIGGDARTWLREHGVNLDGPPPSRPITAEDLQSPSTAPSAAAFSGGQLAPATPAGEEASKASPEIAPFNGAQIGSVAPPASGSSPKTPARTVPFAGAQMAPAVPPTNTITPSPPPGVPAIGGPSVPGVSAPASPAAATAPLSPQSLSQSFTTGMMTGAPAAAGTQSLSEGALHAATQPLSPATPFTAPPMAGTPTIPASAPVVQHVPDAAAAASPAPVVSPPADTTMTSVAPVMTSGQAPAPVAPVSATPAGPLPAYGADLRPPVITPPVAPATPTGPVSGAAVAASVSSSPSAGSSLVSPVAKSTSQTAAQGQPASASSPLAGATVAAAAGAAAGDTGRRTAEQQRLRRIVDAVARQEPALSWAAGLRDDARTTLLVTDLAGGWIPPHVRLPAHLTLLEPATRRRDATVEDLLGAVTVAAVHHPHGYVSEAGPDAPALSGDRTARSAPTIDELGPTLIDHVRRQDGLPRVAQAVAIAAVRKYGVPDNEAELIRDKTTEIRQSVLTAYPDHDIASVVDWMLLAAIGALIDGDQTGANYHLAWALATTSTRRCT
ncbi:DUF5631 domain-containing protein [Mycobacterium pseudokansasii]|uniref:DUF5631 domain-containing protein n=1 Tax=Mycobacterium pseudokansasii TaxID=2341080 RepID=UPI00142E6BB3|nr:DUF5631 domain-containing protein [Mycobacterium pseudokansasii]